MNQKMRLTKADIVGKKIAGVYELEHPPKNRFVYRAIFVQLDNGTIFDLDLIRDPKTDEPLNMWASDYQKAFIRVLSVKNEPNLDSPIKAIIYRKDFECGGAILLENDFILKEGVGEFGNGHDFYLPSKEFRDYMTMEIAG